jgi:lipid-binding SYLF domain-containing protein
MNKFTNISRAASLRRAVLAMVAVCLLAPLSFPSAEAAVSSRTEIDAQSREALARLKEQTSAGAELASRAAGVLVFPKVLKGGLVVGGEYGEGQLRVGGVPTRYYRLASASVGFQLGVQQKSVVILFMTPESLDHFRRSKGWKAGVDASVAIATLGAGDQIDTETARKPVIAFVFSNKGLMYNLTLEGSRITPLGK